MLKVCDSSSFICPKMYSAIIIYLCYGKFVVLVNLYFVYLYATPHMNFSSKQIRFMHIYQSLYTYLPKIHIYRNICTESWMIGVIRVHSTLHTPLNPFTLMSMIHDFHDSRRVKQGKGGWRECIGKQWKRNQTYKAVMRLIRNWVCPVCLSHSSIKDFYVFTYFFLTLLHSSRINISMKSSWSLCVSCVNHFLYFFLVVSNIEIGESRQKTEYT